MGSLHFEELPPLAPEREGAPQTTAKAIPCDTKQECLECLVDWEKEGCDSCAEVCDCYCRQVCGGSPSNSNGPPAYKVKVSNHDRVYAIPRVIHQTWFEDIRGKGGKKYKQMRRLQDSWKSLSNWEYKFYDDNASRAFISSNFPPPFLEAFDTLKVGAYKADFFRYCVLAIEGGVYVDMDVMLQSDLDLLVRPHLTLFVPVDEPGKQGESVRGAKGESWREKRSDEVLRIPR